MCIGLKQIFGYHIRHFSRLYFIFVIAGLEKNSVGCVSRPVILGQRLYWYYPFRYAETLLLQRKLFHVQKGKIRPYFHRFDQCKVTITVIAVKFAIFQYFSVVSFLCCDILPENFPFYTCTLLRMVFHGIVVSDVGAKTTWTSQGLREAREKNQRVEGWWLFQETSGKFI